MSAGTIGVVSGVLARYLAFHRSLQGLDKPEGTAISYGFGPNIAENRNGIVRALQGDWVWFLDDDHVFAPQTLKQLLARRKDIIAPLVLQKEPPHACVVHTEVAERPEGLRFRRKFLTTETGCERVYAVGTAGILVRRKVLTAMGDPWFRVGQLEPNELSEDLDFCHRANQLGFQVWVDYDVQIGHIGPCAVWPMKAQDGTWVTGYHMGQREVPVLPAAVEPKEER